MCPLVLGRLSGRRLTEMSGSTDEHSERKVTLSHQVLDVIMITLGVVIVWSIWTVETVSSDVGLRFDLQGVANPNPVQKRGH